MKLKLLILLSALLLTPFSASAQQVYQPPAPLYGTEWDFDRSKDDLPVGSELEKADAYKKRKNQPYFRDFVVKERDLKEKGKIVKDLNQPEVKVWNLFVDLVSLPTAKKEIREFVTYKDPEEPVLGLVVNITKKQPSWGLAMNIAGADFTNKKWVRDIAIVMVHEYAHLLTKNASQWLTIRKGRGNQCHDKGTYAENYRSCAKKSSYINAFVQQFWTERHLELNRQATTTEELKTFYTQYKDDFVSEYASKSPSEDIAESFTDFVLRKKPLTNASRKDQKILFFYNYPEFIAIRSTLRQELQKYIF